MSYKPNPEDPRVARRISVAIAWSKQHLHPTKPTAVHTQDLQQVFGSSNKPLGRYLRSCLLIRSGNYVVGSKPFDYALNALALAVLQSRFKGLPDVPVPALRSNSVRLTPAVEQELRSLSFNMKRTPSGRLTHPLQRVPKADKRKFWATYGMLYDYDVEACAPTLLYNLLLSFGVRPILYGAISEYLADRSDLRQHVTALLDISLDDAKGLINALFNGATIRANSRCQVFTGPLSSDRLKVELIRGDRRLTHLRKNVKKLWAKVGAELKVPVKTGGDRWSVYYKLEAEVLKIMTEAATAQGAKIFTEHDGFIADRAIDVAAVEAAVLARTNGVQRIKLASTWV